MAKVLVAGPNDCGKTNFIKKCCIPNYVLQERYAQTYSVEYRQFTRKTGDEVVQFTMVDTLGGVMYGTHYSAGAMFNGVRVVLSMFDLSSSKSWESMTYSDHFDNLSSEFTRNASKFTQVNLIVVGMKSDLPQKVSDETVMDFLQSKVAVEVEHTNFTIDQQYFKCSAKTGDGIQDIEDYLIQLITHHTHERGVVKLQDVEQKSSCCF